MQWLEYVELIWHYILVLVILVFLLVFTIKKQKQDRILLAGFSLLSLNYIMGFFSVKSYMIVYDIAISTMEPTGIVYFQEAYYYVKWVQILSHASGWVLLACWFYRTLNTQTEKKEKLSNQKVLVPELDSASSIVND